MCFNLSLSIMLGVYMRDLISMRELSTDDVEEIFSLVSSNSLLDGVVVTAFFEPSTRTKLSFLSAAQRLSLGVVDMLPELSSLKKGESFHDTIKMLDNYADAIVIRSPLEGSARRAADIAEACVINGGDGANQHPTQTLIDLYTIKMRKGLDGIKVAFFGDLKHARTTNSLLYGLAMFGVDLLLISPEGMEVRRDVLEDVRKTFDVKIEEKRELDFEDADIVYMTRVQEERFEDKYMAEKVRRAFSLTSELLSTAADDALILHPLPRRDELPTTFDSTPHAAYFEEASYAVPVRMAIFRWVMS
ncbi:MAG: aspartate carbamoyltransferase [Methanobacteriota archaeon]|nr:MAG: aspartate carbamoyltransferase [Euryarchaeota archaeon]